MTLSFLTFIQGLSLCFSLIISIGIQNTFVLKQGIAKNYNFLIAIICSAGDAILILAGVYGIGQLLALHESLLHFFYWGGVLFLFGYGLMAFHSSFKKQKMKIYDDSNVTGFKKVIITALIVTFLNPMAYLETCVLLGSISAELPYNEKISFSLGAISASFIWFFLLSFGSRFLKPLFLKPISWKILDFVIGCMMFAIAISLIRSFHSLWRNYTW